MITKIPVICHEEKTEIGYIEVEGENARYRLTGEFIIQNFFPVASNYTFNGRPTNGAILSCPRCQYPLCLRGDLRTKGAPSVETDVLIPIIIGVTEVAVDHGMPNDGDSRVVDAG